jgi:hypothetical protein
MEMEGKEQRVGLWGALAAAAAAAVAVVVGGRAGLGCVNGRGAPMWVELRCIAVRRAEDGEVKAVG